MQKADLTTRAVAGFVDLLIVIGLARLPDVVGFLAASGYLLGRDGLYAGQSLGKKLIGLRIAPSEAAGRPVSYRESIIRNTPLALAFLLFLIPYAGWVLCPLVLAVEALAAIGDDRGMRVGDLIALTWTVAAETDTPAAQKAPSQPLDEPARPETAAANTPPADSRETSSAAPAANDPA